MPYDNQKVFKIEALSFCCWLCRYRKQIISIQKSVKNTSVFGIIHRSSHKARKTQISTLLDGDVNLDTVRRVSGHVDSRTMHIPLKQHNRPGGTACCSAPNGMKP